MTGAAHRGGTPLSGARRRAGLALGVARARMVLESRVSHPRVDGTLRTDAPEPVEVVRDHAGVPHVQAESAAGAWWGLGFVQAQDRLFQVDSLRRLASGRVAEALGAPGLATDRLMRRLGFADRAGRDYAWAGVAERAALAAYARGFNAGVRSLSALPPEYALLGAAPEPWHPEHSLLLGRFVLFAFSDNWPSELLRAQLVAALGPEAAAAVEPGLAGRAGVTAAGATATGATATGATVTGAPAAAADLLAAYRAAVTVGMPPRGGSNAWAIAGRHTRSGSPILANDPHLAPRAPAFFHVVHVRGGELDAIGAAIPGVPGIVSGHNGRVAWGITAGLSDSADCYLETVDPQHPLRYRTPDGWAEGRVRVERIAVAGGDPVEEHVLETRHGPVIGPALPAAHDLGDGRAIALRATALEAGATLGPLLRLAGAATVAEAQAALAAWPGPPFNFVLADRTGTIGYRHAGQVPARADGEGLLPQDGATSPGPPPPLPAAALPALLDPPEGIIVSANQPPGGAAYLGADWCEPWRAERITALLTARGEHTVASQFPIQCDVVSAPMLALVERVLPALEPGAADAAEAADGGRQPWADPALRALLRSWDGAMRAGSPQAALAGALWREVAAALAGRLAGAADGVLLGRQAGPYARGSIAARLGGWVPMQLDALPLGDRTRLVRAATTRAIGTLRDALGADPGGWRWGAVHHVTFRHPLADVPGLGDRCSPGPFAAPGDLNTVWQGGTIPLDGQREGLQAAGDLPAYRQVIDLGDVDRSVFQLPTGNGGIPGHPRYDDCVAEFFSGRYRPLLWSAEAVAAYAEHRLRLLPTPGGEAAEAPDAAPDAAPGPAAAGPAEAPA